MQPAIWRTHERDTVSTTARRSEAEKEEFAITRDDEGRGREKLKQQQKRKKKKKKTESRRGGGRGRSGGGSTGGRGEGTGEGGGGGGRGERSSGMKRVTRTERTKGCSVLRPRYTANMAAEGRIGGGQPRRRRRRDARASLRSAQTQRTSFTTVLRHSSGSSGRRPPFFSFLPSALRADLFVTKLLHGKSYTHVAYARTHARTSRSSLADPYARFRRTRDHDDITIGESPRGPSKHCLDS